MRVVFETNAVISALLFRGAASWLVDHWQSGEVTFLLSRETACELLRVLAYPKFALSSTQVEMLAARYLHHAERVECDGEDASLPICRDPDDQMFIRLAGIGRADILVSGDLDLLDLRGTTSFAIENLAEYRRRFALK
ncbi:MAG: putative toxin-antitoxin system toxin component, PIN family [Gallionellaceae bacterium]